MRSRTLPSLFLLTVSVCGAQHPDWINQVANKPFYDVRQYNFAAQSPTSPSSIAIGSNTITLAFCPAGVAGTDSNHYLELGGTGTAEAVLITGGTCTSGAASGTIIITAVGTHSAGYTIQSATAGGQETLNVAIAAGSYRHICFPAGGYTTFAPIFGNGNSNIWIDLDKSAVINLAFASGSPFTSSSVNPWSDLSIGNGYFFYNTGTKGTSYNVTSNVNYPVASRASASSVTIPMSSVSGWSVGDYVFMQYQGWGNNAGSPAGQQEFAEVSRVTNISSLNVTFQDNIVVPLATAAVVGPPGNNQSPVYRFTPITNNWVTGGTIDGATGVANSAAVGGVGLFYAVDSGVADATLQNLNNGGLTFGKGYRISATNTRTYNASGFSDVWFIGVTHPVLTNLVSVKGNFGPAVWWAAFGKISNVNSSFSQGRGVKLMGYVAGSVNGVWVSNANKTGFSIEAGSYNNHFQGVTVTGSGQGSGTNNWGYYSTGEGNLNNTHTDITAFGNNGGGNDLILGALDGFSDDNNILKNVYAPGGAPLQSTGCRIDFNDQQATGTASSGAVTVNNAQYLLLTTDSLSVTHNFGASYTLTITSNRILSANSVLKVTLQSGSSTQGIPTLGNVTPGTGSATIVIWNAHPSLDMNGTIKVKVEISSIS